MQRKNRHRLLKHQLEDTNLDSASTVDGLEAFLHDVDETYREADRRHRELKRKLDDANSRLELSEDILRNTLESTADGILTLDNSNHTLHANSRFFEIWGMPREYIEPDNRALFLDFILSHVLNSENFLQYAAEIAASNRESIDLIELKDGRIIERYSRPLMEHASVTGRVWSFRDVTARQQLEEQLRQQAFHDPLTGLYNRARLLDRVDHALDHCRRDGGSAFLLFLDLDDFKAVNDSLGHVCGDQVLRIVAERIDQTLRAVDSAARLGGDEFAILLENLASPSAAEVVALRLLDAISRPMQVSDATLDVGASIGIAESSPDMDPEELMRRADMAMYAAKREGKRRYRLHEAPGQQRLSA